MNKHALVSLAQAASTGASEALSISTLVRGVVGSLVYSTVGLVMFAVAFFIINKVVPFSIRKEIEDDQNTSLGIVIAAVIVGIAMIVSAAVHG
jgi:putative membrane protein